MEEKKYYTLQKILNFIGFDFEFERSDKKYPFNMGKECIEFSWGQVLIPKHGIDEMVQNKISDIKENPITEIKMMYQIPFICTKPTEGSEPKTGIINKNISLTFRYDKEYKYGDINKTIYEVCYYIQRNGIKTNDFYIISDTGIFDFMSYFVIDNQWGLGSLVVTSPCMEKYEN